MNATLNINTCTLSAPAAYAAPQAPAAAPAPTPTTYAPEVPVTALATLSPEALASPKEAQSNAEFAKFDPADKSALFGKAFAAGLFSSEQAAEIKAYAQELTDHFVEGRAEAGRPASEAERGEVAYMALAHSIDQAAVHVAQTGGVQTEEQAHLLVELEHAASNYVSLRGEYLGGSPAFFNNLMENPAFGVA